ncbi:MAG: U-box domain-containing protein [Gammaproteobacteria bacterium]
MFTFENTVKIVGSGLAGLTGTIASLLFYEEKDRGSIITSCVTGLICCLIIKEKLDDFFIKLRLSARNDPIVLQTRTAIERIRRDRELLRSQHATGTLSTNAFFSNRIDPYALAGKISGLAAILEERGNIDELPKDVFCPIDRTVMKDPVQTASGHSYERSALQSYYYAGGASCPMNRNIPLGNPRTLPTNLALQIRIHAILKEKTESMSSAKQNQVKVGKMGSTQ